MPTTRHLSAQTDAACYIWLCYPFSYNAIGNLTHNSYGTLTYGASAHKHAVTAWNGNSYGYDANGNQTTRTIGGSTSTLTYDAENRLTTVSGATTASFKYGVACNTQSLCGFCVLCRLALSAV